LLSSSAPAEETPRKQRPFRPFVSTRGGAGASAPSFQVEETPLRSIVEETPAAKRPSRGPRSLLGPDADAVGAARRDAVVAETPAPRGGGGGGPGAPSFSVRPTTLWGAPQDAARPAAQPTPPRRSWSDDPLSHYHALPLRDDGGSYRHSSQQGRSIHNEEAPPLTPVNCRSSIGASSLAIATTQALNFCMSPMPQRADLGSVVAEAARAHNARKKK
jgi:hypothetical protein